MAVLIARFSLPGASSQARISGLNPNSVSGFRACQFAAPSLKASGRPGFGLRAFGPSGPRDRCCS